MGEETTTQEIAKPDFTMFRHAQQDVAANPQIFKEVVNEDIKKSIGNDGEPDQTLFNTVEEYTEIMNEPYSVKFYKAKEIYNTLTEGDFKSIDKYILDKIKSTKQKSTFEVYNKVLRQLEGTLNLSDDHDTMHRIVTISKFIQHGNQ